MPSAEIGNINISGNKAGMAYGGFIYSLNINIGSSATPTKLSISVVHKQGINDKTRKNLQKDKKIFIIPFYLLKMRQPNY